MIQKESYGFNTFAATRIGEIQKSSHPEEWYWVEGKTNVADILTRGTKLNNLGPTSKWQNGPKFLDLPVDFWPIRNECLTMELPEKGKMILTIVKNNEDIIDISRFSNYYRLIRTTARILSLRNKTQNYSLQNIGKGITPHSFETAEMYWVLEAQRSVSSELKAALGGKGVYKRLSLKKREDGVYVVGKRIEIWNEMSYNKLDIPILPKEHRFSWLYTEMVHRSGHLGINTEVSKIQTRFWIVSAGRIVKSIKSKCVTCRKRDKQLASQIMSPLPLERLKPAPPWSSVGIDLFGPFHIRGEVNKRSSGKCYGVIFTCLLIRAVHLELTSDYSTEGFLMAFRRFTAICGFPNKVFSDGRSQLVGAYAELQSVYKNLDWRKIKSFGTNKCMEWVFSPGDSPWYNGCCEALIKSIKSIYHAINQNRINFSELHTILYEISSLINERPIGIKPMESEDGSYLCRNDLLLGRSSGKIPYQEMDQNASTKKRFSYVQRLVDAFWKKWITFFFPSLIIQSKWHHEIRNMMVGDIVLIQDSKMLRGQWKTQELIIKFDGLPYCISFMVIRHLLILKGRCKDWYY